MLADTLVVTRFRTKQCNEGWCLIWWRPSACVRRLPPAHQSRLRHNAASGRDFHLSLHGVVRSKQHAPRQSGCSFPPVRFKNNKLRAALTLLATPPASLRPQSGLSSANHPNPSAREMLGTVREKTTPPTRTCRLRSPHVKSCPRRRLRFIPAVLQLGLLLRDLLTCASLRRPRARKRFVFDKTKLCFASHDRIPATTINQAQVTAVGVWASTTQPASVPVRQPEPFNHPPAAIPYRPRPCRDAQCKSNSQRLPPTNKNAVSA